jgi:hypothetical protein
VDLNRQRGFASAARQGEMQLALYDGWYRGQPERGVQRLDAALVKYPLSTIPPLQRPYIFLSLMYANFGRPEKARALLAEQQRVVPAGQLQAAEYDRHFVQGEIALADRNAELAKSEFRASDRGDCALCPLPGLVRAFLIAGQPDSAIAAGEKYLETQSIAHGNLDPIYRAAIYRRLGELYEARGDTSLAASSYARFIEAWKDADPDLQARVADARRRLQALKRNEGS